ncbi:MAG: glycosyltransferase family 2 protein [Betaproteobacteria bacterium]
MNTTVLIPAYNEASTLSEILRGVLVHESRVLVVDDGSTDGTADSIADLAVDVIRHSRNIGKSASLVDGFAWALDRNASRVLTMDGDGQHRAADIARLLHAADAYPRAIIIGARIRRTECAPPSRRLANRLADFGVSWAVGRRVLDSQSGQRVYPASLLRALDLRRLSRGSFTLESEIIIEAARLGYATVSVPIDAIYDPLARKSYFRPARHIPSIFAMLAGKLVGKRFNPRGLWTSLRERATLFDDGADARALEPVLQRVREGSQSASS